MWLPIPPWTSLPTPPPLLLSFHSSLDLSLRPEIFMAGSEKWMHLPKGAEVEDREVSRFARYSLMMKVTEGFESSRCFRKCGWRDCSCCHRCLSLWEYMHCERAQMQRVCMWRWCQGNAAAFQVKHAQRKFKSIARVTAFSWKCERMNEWEPMICWVCITTTLISERWVLPYLTLGFYWLMTLTSSHRHLKQGEMVCSSQWVVCIENNAHSS